jgi:Bcr/CflA subfamily drug resistance transporter
MKNVKIYFAIVLACAALGQLATNLYLPSLPDITTAFNTTYNTTQLSITWYMFGYCLSQFIYGPLSDAYGRKIFLLTGMSLFAIASVICIFSTSIYMLIIGRCLQGFGVGAGVTLSISILRDVFMGEKLAKATTYLSLVGVSLISIAPLLGSFLHVAFGWKASFITLLIYTACVIAAIIFYLPETNLHKEPNKIKPRNIKNSLVKLLTSEVFLKNLCGVILCYAGIMAWVTVSPILLQVTLNFSTIAYGWLTALVGMAFVLGSLINSLLLSKLKILTIIKGALVIMFCSSLLMLLWSPFLNIFVIIIPMALFFFSASFVLPNILAEALTPFPQIAGIASAIFGGAQMLGGTASSGIMAYASESSQLPLALALLLCSFIGLIIYFNAFKFIFKWRKPV